MESLKKLQDHVKSLRTGEEASASELGLEPDIKKAFEDGDIEEFDGYTRVGNLFILHHNVDYDGQNALWLQELRAQRIYPQKSQD